jgi:Fur family ferric uptake transcriptional regulator
MTRRPEPRLSKNCRLVYEIVREAAANGRHVPIADLYARARERQPRIGYATIYRAITRLRDLRLVEGVHIPGASSAVFEPMGKKHAHFRCDVCGVMRDADVALSQRALRSAARRLDAELSGADVVLRGRCATCR